MRTAISHDRDVAAHSRRELFGAQMHRRLRRKAPSFRVQGRARHGVKRFVNARPGARKPQRLALVEDTKLPVRVRDRGRRRDNLRQPWPSRIRLRVGAPRGDVVLQYPAAEPCEDAFERGFKQARECPETFFQKMPFVLDDEARKGIVKHDRAVSIGGFEPRPSFVLSTGE